MGATFATSRCRWTFRGSSTPGGCGSPRDARRLAQQAVEGSAHRQRDRDRARAQVGAVHPAASLSPRPRHPQGEVLAHGDTTQALRAFRGGLLTHPRGTVASRRGSGICAAWKKVLNTEALAHGDAQALRAFREGLLSHPRVIVAYRHGSGIGAAGREGVKHGCFGEARDKAHGLIQDGCPRKKRCLTLRGRDLATSISPRLEHRVQSVGTSAARMSAACPRAPKPL